MHDTQRSPRSFGIKPGTEPGSHSSKRLDQIVRGIIADIEVKHWRPQYSARELHTVIAPNLGMEHRMAGFRPDGGIFTTEDGLPLLAIECKYQGDSGNAIERWYKNFAISQRLGIQRYVTFCLGDGFFDNNSSSRILTTAAALFQPDLEDPWASEEGMLGLYRWRTLEEAEAELPEILLRNLGRLHSSYQLPDNGY